MVDDFNNEENELEPYQEIHPMKRCVKEENTFLKTATESYVYTCPECGINRRYSIPEQGEYIGCDGNDLGVYKLTFDIE